MNESHKSDDSRGPSKSSDVGALECSISKRHFDNDHELPHDNACRVNRQN